jgi:hypothetical protein
MFPLPPTQKANKLSAVWVVGQFECKVILKGCELIAVGERCDTHGTRSELILTLKGVTLAAKV